MNFDTVYKSLSDFPIDDYCTFVKAVDTSYQNMTSRKYEIDNDKRHAFNLSQISRDKLHDSFVIRHRDVSFDCLMTPYDINTADSLFVIFSGARTVKNGVIVDQLPIFKRWSYYEFTDSIVLNIADPMFHKHGNLALGWYYGSKTESYIEYLAKIIEYVCNTLNIKHEKLFLFGSSGGGYVALQLSMYLKNANHIAINPQIFLDKFSYSKEFCRQTGINLTEKDPYRRNETIDIIKEKILSNDSKFLILQNLQEKRDCEEHIFPLLKNLGIQKLHLGLNEYQNLLFWLYSCVGGHNTQGDQLIFSHILYLAKKLSSSDKISSYDHFLIKNISCLWRQIEWYKFRASQLSSCNLNINSKS